jgi:large subunit ribosomal protein L2
MAISNFNYYYKDYKKYLKSITKNNLNYKPLVKGLLKKTGGRNNKGFITAYHRGGGVKRLFKKICFSYINLLQLGLKQWIVERIEYDSNRSCNIALLKYNKMRFKLKKIYKKRQKQK